jgi:uncharacterized protein YkwD
VGSRLALVGVAGAGALLLAGCTSAPAPTDQIATTAAVSLGAPDDYARTVFDLINAQRESSGLTALVWNECLASLATTRAANTLDEVNLSHEPLAASCTSGDLAGENLARTWQGPEGMVTLWLDSPSHHDNLLRPVWAESGVGCVAYSFADTSIEATAGAPAGGMACSQLFEGTG